MIFKSVIILPFFLQKDFSKLSNLQTGSASSTGTSNSSYATCKEEQDDPTNTNKVDVSSVYVNLTTVKESIGESSQ